MSYALFVAILFPAVDIAALKVTFVKLLYALTKELTIRMMCFRCLLYFSFLPAFPGFIQNYLEKFQINSLTNYLSGICYFF